MAKYRLKGEYFYCYSASMFSFLKEKGFYAVFLGYNKEMKNVAVFEKTVELKKALGEYQSYKAEQDWDY